MNLTKLKITREQEGLTQEEVAKKAKTSTRSYQDYESGKRLPNVLTAIRIAHALNSTVEELFQGKDTTNERKNQKN